MPAHVHSAPGVRLCSLRSTTLRLAATGPVPCTLRHASWPTRLTSAGSHSYIVPRRAAPPVLYRVGMTHQTSPCKELQHDLAWLLGGEDPSQRPVPQRGAISRAVYCCQPS